MSSTDEGQQVATFVQNFAAGTDDGVFGQQAHDTHGGHALAATRLSPTRATVEFDGNVKAHIPDGLCRHGFAHAECNSAGLWNADQIIHVFTSQSGVRALLRK